MTDSRNCKRCGATLHPGGSLQGLCPACLMGLGMAQDAGAYTAPSGASEPPPDPEELAALLPAFEIEEILGQGGMGVVYRARQKSLDRLVAIKVLPASLDRDPSFHDRFAREARALASLNHPNIVGVYDFGKAGGHYFLTMEYVDGTDLRRMERTEQISPRQALNLVGQLCDALQYAHDQGVVHRDIKPENVLIDRQGRVKVSDFGLAKLVGGQRGRASMAATLTRADQIMGTPMYMAPEQVEHPLEVDHRADLYSLGVVFYELLTGELPLGRFASPSVAHAGVDARLDPIVLRALEKEPPARYQHASAIRTDVDRVAQAPAAGSNAEILEATAAALAEAEAAADKGGFGVIAKVIAGRGDSKEPKGGPQGHGGHGHQGDSRPPQYRGCGYWFFAGLAVLLGLALVFGCLAALFLAGAQSAPEAVSNSETGALEYTIGGDRPAIVERTPPGVSPGGTPPLPVRPLLATARDTILLWSAGGPELADELRLDNDVSLEDWTAAQALVEDLRERYLALEAGHVHVVPGAARSVVIVHAFQEERAVLGRELDRGLSSILGRSIAPYLVGRLENQLFPLGSEAGRLELFEIDGQACVASDSFESLDDRGDEVLARFGHLAERLWLTPPDAGAHAARLAEVLASRCPEGSSLEVETVVAQSDWDDAGPVVEVRADLRLTSPSGTPLTVWAELARSLAEEDSDWILEASLRGGSPEPLEESANGAQDAGFRLSSVQFVLRPGELVATTPLSLREAELQGLTLRARLEERFPGSTTSASNHRSRLFFPGSVTVKLKSNFVLPAPLSETAAELSAFASEDGWAPTRFAWSDAGSGQFEASFQHVLR